MRQPTHETASLDDQCGQAIDKLDRAMRLHPRELEKELDQIQRDVVRLRDQLIDRLRLPQASPASGKLHVALERVNIALTLIVGVEYPATSIQRSALEQARDTLKKVLSAGLLSSSA